MSLGIVTGLTAEARIVTCLGQVLAGGGSAAGAARAATQLADEGATALLSFGLAGGLRAALHPGAIVIPAAVHTDNGNFVTDGALAAWLGGVTAQAIFASASVLAHAADKQVLWRRSGADAVDMESGAVAAVAHARGLPFAVLRAVCDTADADLPPAALVALNARGAIGLSRVAGAVLRAPSQIPALLRLASQAAAARAALIRHVALLSAKGAFQAP
jgi:adenosylhomocysteine nucleosidase